MATQVKERMTAEDAKRFGRYSAQNAGAVYAALKCGCQPYQDVFTFKRWIALGFVVRKGEKAIKLPLVKDVTKTDEETGEETTGRRILGLSFVFCRCQVQPLGAKA